MPVGQGSASMTTRRFGVGLAAALVLAAFWPGAGAALTIYPIDRAEILAGSRFDVKVEFDGVIPETDARVTINGGDAAALLGQRPVFSARERVDASALLLRDVSLGGARAGTSSSRPTAG